MELVFRKGLRKKGASFKVSGNGDIGERGVIQEQSFKGATFQSSRDLGLPDQVVFSHHFRLPAVQLLT